ncbi:MAG: hypothetical protein ILA34_02235 [Bacteroidaceae bacterium]|nr:hypothetical protein [Bacteroidaceae bacterium]
MKSVLDKAILFGWALLLLAGCTDYNRILEEVHDKDQAAREWSLGMASLSSDDVARHSAEMRAVDSLNRTIVFGILDQHGWPSGLSAKANDGIWLVIDHADDECQRKYLPLVREKTEEDIVKPSDYATLYDRLLMHEGKPQMYGTQVRMAATFVGEDLAMQLFLWPVQDADGLDSLRASVGLSPIGSYLEATQKATGQAVQWDKRKTVADF